MKLTRIGEIRRAGQQAGLYNRNLLEAFEKGAKWADENPEEWMDVSIIGTSRKVGAWLLAGMC
jgi:hypothetical protein